MSIPGSLLSAILPTTIPAVQQTARNLAQGVTQAFGEWIQPPPESANGPLEPNFGAPTNQIDSSTDPKSESPSDRLRARLAQWLQAFTSSLGLKNVPPGIAIVSDGVGIPRVDGPEEITSDLQQSLLQDPDLIDAINQATRSQLENDPLQWMPGHEPVARWAIPAARS